MPYIDFEEVARARAEAEDRWMRYLQRVRDAEAKRQAEYNRFDNVVAM